MAVTQKDIDDLQAAIWSGTKKAKRGDREVEYRDLSEMNRTLASMKKELGTVIPKSLQPRIDRGYQ